MYSFYDVCQFVITCVCVCVCVCVCKCIGFEEKVAYSLLVLGSDGVLTEHYLQPSKVPSANEGDDAPIGLEHSLKRCWKLLRYTNKYMYMQLFIKVCKFINQGYVLLVVPFSIYQIYSIIHYMYSTCMYLPVMVQLQLSLLHVHVVQEPGTENLPIIKVSNNLGYE